MLIIYLEQLNYKLYNHFKQFYLNKWIYLPLLLPTTSCMCIFRRLETFKLDWHMTLWQIVTKSLILRTWMQSVTTLFQVVNLGGYEPSPTQVKLSCKSMSSWEYDSKSWGSLIIMDSQKNPKSEHQPNNQHWIKRNCEDWHVFLI